MVKMPQEKNVYLIIIERKFLLLNMNKYHDSVSYLKRHELVISEGRPFLNMASSDTERYKLLRF